MEGISVLCERNPRGERSALYTLPGRTTLRISIALPWYNEVIIVHGEETAAPPAERAR